MDPDPPIRVALVRLAPLVRDVVHSLIDSTEDMRVTAVVERAESENVADDDVADDDVADVYVVGVENGDAASTCEPLLGEPAPPRRVIGISLDGRQMHVSELRPSTSAIGSLSSEELLDVIRRVKA
jgi:DNA-binding NarL/FixJ family response regulator